MTQAKDFDTKLLLRTLAELGRRLADRRLVGEIAVYGGGAMLLQFDVERRTHDLDVRVVEGHGPVFDAARQVERTLELPSGWLSEAVVQYASRLEGPDAFSWHAKFPERGTAGLRVFVAKPEYLLAMKMVASRSASQDFSDAEVLADACGITDAPALEAAIQRWYPGVELPEHVQDAILAVGSTLSQKAGPR